VQHIKVFVSSPGDVADERRIVHAILRDLEEAPAWQGKISIRVIRWDNPNSPTPMYANYSPQEAVNLHLPKPSECDVVVLLLWSRFGTPMSSPLRDDGTQYLSGTEWEYEDARDANVRVLLFKRADEPVASLRDPDFDERKRQLGLVDAFFARVTGGAHGARGGYISYTAAEFETKFRNIIESVLRQMIDGGPHPEHSSREIIERLTKALDEAKRENLDLRQQLVLRRASPAPAGPFLGTDPRVSKPSIDVEVQRLSGSDTEALQRDAAVVAVAPAMPLRLIAPIKDELVGPTKPVAWGVSAVGADTSPFSGSGVVVAILDTGIDEAHPAFAGVQLIQRDFTGEGDGDRLGHGTHFAATVFGRDVDGVRIGVARGVRKALIAKVVSAEGSSSDMLVTAIQWAVDQGADLIGLSLAFDTAMLEHSFLNHGMTEVLARAEALQAYVANVQLCERLSSLLQAAALSSKSSLIVAAAGNDSEQVHAAPVTMPAGIEGILSVAALAKEGPSFVTASFSNAGALVSAPGVRIVSARAGGGLATLTGTSTSAAHVVGVAALWLEKLRRNAPAPTPTLQTLLASATKVGVRDASDAAVAGLGLVHAPQE
jgi:hypothetical protein